MNVTARTALKRLRRASNPTTVVISLDDAGSDGSDALRGDFLATIGHELKTPVGALSLLAETMELESEPEILHRLASRVRFEADRLATIVDELLEFSRDEHGTWGKRENVRVADFVRDAVERIRPAAHAADVRLDLRHIDFDLKVFGSRRQLVSALGNLIENGVKYSKQHGTVALRTTSRAGNVEVHVRDNGIGVAREEIGKIFDRFYRAPSAATIPGTGLGLAIVRQVAVSHGGDVAVRSVEGRGSEFTLSLPLSRTAVRASAGA